MRDKVSEGCFYLISEFPFTFACIYIVAAGDGGRRDGVKPPYWSLTSHFSRYVDFSSHLCEDRAGCCGATSQNSWSGTCTFCTSWYLKTHQPFKIASSLYKRPFFLSLSFIDFHWLDEEITANIAHVQTKADTSQKNVSYMRENSLLFLYSFKIAPFVLIGKTSKIWM